MSLSWSPQQREWLQALGHPLLVLAPDRPVATEANAEPHAPSVPGPAVAAPPLASDPGAPADGLRRALLKATGLAATEAERALEAFGVEAAALRGDPAAKRLLWTCLRGLRRNRPT